MDDNDLLDFITAYNDATSSEKPVTVLDWLLFIDKKGFQLRKKY